MEMIAVYKVFDRRSLKILNYVGFDLADLSVLGMNHSLKATMEASQTFHFQL